MSNSLSGLGSESQKLLIEQIKQIDLDRVAISAKNLSVLGASLMKILRTANSCQESSTEEGTRDRWIIIRQLTQTYLEEILVKLEELSDREEIPDWERPSVMGLLHDITKACQQEELRTNLGDKEYSQLDASDEFIDKLLEDDKLL